jgi:hypothetical protein
MSALFVPQTALPPAERYQLALNSFIFAISSTANASNLTKQDHKAAAEQKQQIKT